MKRVMRRSRVTRRLEDVGFAADLAGAKAVAEADATKRDRWAVYELESVYGNTVMTVRQVNGEYHVLLVDEPTNRPSAEQIDRVMSRFDDPVGVD